MLVLEVLHQSPDTEVLWPESWISCSTVLYHLSMMEDDQGRLENCSETWIVWFSQLMKHVFVRKCLQKMEWNSPLLVRSFSSFNAASLLDFSETHLEIIFHNGCLDSAQTEPHNLVLNWFPRKELLLKHCQAVSTNLETKNAGCRQTLYSLWDHIPPPPTTPTTKLV